MMEIKTTDAIIDSEHIYHALYLPGYIKRLEKALTNHEYGNGYVYKDEIEIRNLLSAAKTQLHQALDAIQDIINSVNVANLPAKHANLALRDAIRYLDGRYCNYNEDAVGLFFAVDILPHLEKESIWAYLEVIPEGWVVRDLRIEPASEPGYEIHCGRIVRSFGTHITWSGYEHLPK